MATFIIGAVIIAIVALAIRNMYKSNKKGNGCGCGCEGCSKSKNCH